MAQVFDGRLQPHDGLRIGGIVDADREAVDLLRAVHQALQFVEPHEDRIVFVNVEAFEDADDAIRLVFDHLQFVAHALVEIACQNLADENFSLTVGIERSAVDHADGVEEEIADLPTLHEHAVKVVLVERDGVAQLGRHVAHTGQLGDGFGPMLIERSRKALARTGAGNHQIDAAALIHFDKRAAEALGHADHGHHRPDGQANAGNGDQRANRTAGEVAKDEAGKTHRGLREPFCVTVLAPEVVVLSARRRIA